MKNFLAQTKTANAMLDDIAADALEPLSVEKAEKCSAATDFFVDRAKGNGLYYANRPLFISLCKLNPAGKRLSNESWAINDHCELPLEFRICFVCNNLFANKEETNKLNKFERAFNSCKSRMQPMEWTVFSRALITPNKALPAP
ncbi:MAG: hypothetical protein IOD12_11475 [Silvanigrellales bacterium]|nr:hypothetical protein [Silvanigrellales bacterium]